MFPQIQWHKWNKEGRQTRDSKKLHSKPLVYNNNV